MANHLDKNYKAVGYTRVSANLQAERNDNANRQAARIREACAAQGWALRGIYDDVASAVGKDIVRPSPALSACKIVSDGCLAPFSR